MSWDFPAPAERRGDPLRQVKPGTVSRVSCPPACKTKPFIFHRLRRGENEFCCFPFPDCVDGDGLETKPLPTDRFCLIWDADKKEWAAIWEHLLPILGRREYDEMKGQWFSELAQAVEFLRACKGEIEAA